MPTPSPEEFWKLLIASRLVEPAMVEDLRRAYDREQPAAGGDAATAAIAKWLVQRGVVSKWQGRRLLGGDSGPFFVGDYRLMDRLENEGTGRLFRCRHEPSGRRVCLMVLDRKLCQRVDVWTEVVRRTEIAHAATDPLLSRTWALDQVQGNRVIVCEDVEGVSLADELSRLGPLPPAEACAVLLPIFTAVAELHRRGAVHGSLSLDALRREPAAAGGAERSGRVRLLQHPLAGDPHAVPTQPPVDATERVAGLGRRASFVAPELLLPGRVADERSDVYSLGCMLHALLTGVPPCWQGDAQRTLSQAAFVGPPPLGPPQVPVEVATLVSYLVAREPTDRYPNAAEAADALAGCLGLPPVSSALPPAQGGAGVRAAAEAGTPGVPFAGVQPPAAAAVAMPAATVAAGPAVADIRRAAEKRASRLGIIGLGAAAGVVMLTLGILLARTGSWSGAAARDGAGSADSGDGAADAGPPRPDAAMRSREAAAPDGRDTARGADTESESVADGAAESGGAEMAGRRPAADDGPVKAAATVVPSATLPWAPPTAGGPPTLAYLPPGSQLVLLVRPAEIVADEEGGRFVRSLGPRVAEAIAVLESVCGRGLEEIVELQAGWQAADGGGTDPVVGWAVRFAEPSALLDDAAARTRAWGETAQQEVEGETLYVGPRLTAWFPAVDEGRVLVLGSPRGIDAVVAEPRTEGPTGGDGPLAANLPQDLEELVGMLDRTRHLTLFGSPAYLLSDGRQLLSGPLATLATPLGQFFGDGIQAAALSLHFGTDFYAEIDTVAPRAEPATTLAPRLARQVDTLPDAVEDACNAITLHPYGKKLVGRLPAMVRVLAANMRSGAEGKGVVLNAYLPRPAGHNLVLAAELALEQAAAGGGAAPVATKGTAPATGAAAALQKKITLVFAKDTLEKSIQMVADEIGIPMEIVGRDLQLDGITQNQSFALEERNKPADAVLRSILAKADSAGRLVYVVRSRDGGEAIEITTKAAAASRGDKLPAGF